MSKTRKKSSSQVSANIELPSPSRPRQYKFLSMGVRLLANVEALNMVETAGNLSRHRTVPYVVIENGNYQLKWLPALSGETLAHAFQSHLADNSSNVCYFCKMHEFLKHTAMDFYCKLLNSTQSPPFDQWEINLINNYNNMTDEDLEKTIVENCVVEDVGGFLLATAAGGGEGQGKMVRRTSAIQFSYAIPTLDAVLVGASTTDIQMQVRMAVNAQSYANRIGYNYPIQIPYNKEMSSTTYSYVVNVDFDMVGYSSYTNEDLLSNIQGERTNRFNAILSSLKLVVDGNFGAGMSRYRPFLANEVILTAVTEGAPTFVVSPPSLRLEAFLKETIERAKDYMKEFSNVNITLYLWVRRDYWDSNPKIKDIVKSYGYYEKNNTISISVEGGRNLTLKVIIADSVGPLFDELRRELGLLVNGGTNR